MKNFTIYLASVLCLFLSKITAQETFEGRAQAIAVKIEQITKEEKAALKLEVEAIDAQVQNGALTSAQAEERKSQLATARARNIETRTAAAHDELRILVQEKVDGKIAAVDSTKKHPTSFSWKFERDTVKHSERRTTSQFVFAFGVNNLATNQSVAHSDFRGWGSHFYEWGITSNTRILKDNNLLHAKYGLSLMYNNLRPTENRMFVDNGEQTDLVVSPVDLDDSRFRNVYLVVPLHLEFDFSRNRTVDGNKIFRSHEGLRFGIGGYAGLNLKSKQILKFEQNGNDHRNRERGDFNVNDFMYGVSSYIGWGETSLYVKYDLNPLFADNAIDQHNVSLGLRFDLN